MSTSFNAANSVLRSVTSPAMKSTPAGRSFGRPYGWTFGSRLSKTRSEEHTSELQSRLHLVCRLLLEKKKTTHDIFATCIPRPSTLSVFAFQTPVFSPFSRTAPCAPTPILSVKGEFLRVIGMSSVEHD